MNRLKFHVKKGDKSRSSPATTRVPPGKILAVLPKKQQVLVEGVRMIKKHTRKSQDHPQGAIIEREGPIHISNVKLVEARRKAKRPRRRRRQAKKKASKG